MKTVLQELFAADREEIWKYLMYRYEDYNVNQLSLIKEKMFQLIDTLLIQYKDHLKKEEMDIENVIIPYSSFDYENNQWFIGISTMAMNIEDLYQISLPNAPTLELSVEESDNELHFDFTEDLESLLYMSKFIEEMSKSCDGGHVYLVYSWNEVIDCGVPEQTAFDIDYILADLLYCMTIWGFDLDQREKNRQMIMKKINSFAKKASKKISSVDPIVDINEDHEDVADDREPGRFEIERLNTSYLSFCSLYLSILVIKEDCFNILC